MYIYQVKYCDHKVTFIHTAVIFFMSV